MINIANSDNNAQEIYLAQMGIRECTNRVSFDASIKSLPCVSVSNLAPCFSWATPP